MVAQSDRARCLHQLRGVVTHDLGANLGMLLHDLPLVGRELARLEQDAVRDAELADVVHRRGLQHQVAFALAHPEAEREQACRVAHAQHVHPRLVISVFAGTPQAADDFEPRFGQLARASLNFVFEGEVPPVQRNVSLYP